MCSHVCMCTNTSYPTLAYNTLCWFSLCLGLLLGLGSWPALRLCLWLWLCCPSPSSWLAGRPACGCTPLPALALLSPTFSLITFSLIAFTFCIHLSLSLAFTLSLSLSPAFSLSLCWAPSSATAPPLVGLVRLFVLLWLWSLAPSEARQATGDPLVKLLQSRICHIFCHVSWSFAMSVNFDWALRMSFWGAMLWSWIPLKIAFRSGGFFTKGSLSLFCESKSLLASNSVHAGIEYCTKVSA